MTAVRETSARATSHRQPDLPGARSADGHLKICQATLKLDTQSETFVRSHRDSLPFAVDAVAIEAWDKPVLRTEQGLVFPRDPLSRFLRQVSHARVREPLNGRFRRAFARYLRRSQCVCVLAEYGTTGAAVAESCSMAGIPLVVHFHGFDAHVREVVEQMREDYARLFNEASAVVAVSRTMREALIALGCPPQKIRVIPCGVNVDQFQRSHPPPRREGKPFQFLFVGRFVSKKAPVHLLLAFQECIRHVDAKLVMAGDGPLFDLAREVAGALGLQGKVIFPGAVSHEEVRQLLAESDAYVQHSIRAASGDCEGSPVAIVEAAAAGLPVVSTRHAGIVDSVLEGQTGFLVEEGDVAGMGREMASLARDPALCGRLGQAGREHVCLHYSLEVTTRALADVLRVVCRAGA